MVRLEALHAVKNLIGRGDRSAGGIDFQHERFDALVGLDLLEQAVEALGLIVHDGALDGNDRDFLRRIAVDQVRRSRRTAAKKTGGEEQVEVECQREAEDGGGEGNEDSACEPAAALALRWQRHEHGRVHRGHGRHRRHHLRHRRHSARRRRPGGRHASRRRWRRRRGKGATRVDRTLTRGWLRHHGINSCTTAR